MNRFKLIGFTLIFMGSATIFSDMSKAFAEESQKMPSEAQREAFRHQFSEIMAMSKETDYASLRFPANEKEWTVLLNTARYGPEACWKALGGVEKGMGKFYAGRTWQELGVDDPKTGCREMAVKWQKLVIKSSEADTKGNLAELRTAIITYYGDTEGRNPRDLNELVPKYIEKIPLVDLSGLHARSTGITYFKSFTPNDAGGWGYVANPETEDDGKVFINCTHKDSRGNLWTSY